MKKGARRYPIGAELKENGVNFRLWAPDHKDVRLIIFKGKKKHFHLQMEKEKKGYFSLFVPNIGEGTLYQFELSNNGKWLADPASRFQPYGPLGPSSVVNMEYPWTDQRWQGKSIENQIIYEMHIGTFTQEGTFSAAANQLKELAKLGITTIEIMPINEFPGNFGWGYDGVNLFAPYHHYGTPQDVKEFINRAHKLEIGVILDVVYNHFGPDANQVTEYAKDYLSKKHMTEWGQAINFDLHEAREFFLTNVKYWIEEFHFDGLRVDATPWFFCSTPKHILAEITKTARRAAGRKKIILIGENEKQDTFLLRSYKEKGYAFDALWNDDVHHSAIVRLTGKREAYYVDYLGSPQEFISAAKYGFLYQGQYYDWYKDNRGVPHLDLPHASMIAFLESHDQVANSGYGKRLHELSDPGNYKALVTYIMLGPSTPMLFQGQEFNSSHPFSYFADHGKDMNTLIYEERKKSLARFPRLATPEISLTLQDPSNPLTFTSCKLDFKERNKNQKIYAFFRDLIHLRKEDPIFKKMSKNEIDGAVLTNDAFLIRYFGKEADRLLIVNFGADHYFNPSPEPLLVAGVNKEWQLLFSSEAFAYDGEGTPEINIPFWKILGHSAIVLGTRRKKKLKTP